ncbi:hypothetical protein CASFOL_023300 [Castilleja foliolosa]|uniref:Cupin type-1 domain-containing protein n=1 Tax=Castilleja foliolosa TaxID=1961234 RepID=A0ABD3CLY8_9LAMI
MSKKSYSISVVALFLWCAIAITTTTGVRASGSLVKTEQRKTLFFSEDGQISAARVADNINGSYLLHFFTLEPNSLFLPALLHADMIFYVHTGSGKLSWTYEDELKSTEITRGDVFRLEQGSFFFINSNLETETERQKLRINAIFFDSNNDLHEPAIGPYSSIRDMVLGFDREVLKSAFKVPEEVIDDLLNGTSPPAIVHGLQRTKKAAFEMEAQFMSSFLGTRGFNIVELNKKKKKKKSDAKLYNLFKEDKDFENCNGWSTTVTGKKLSALRGSDVGLFMVNLTAGSMMGPHWNPTATEVAVVLQGRGMVRVVCSSFSNGTHCRNKSFEVEEGDVFAVPRFHPMAQISFNNGTLVFMGFSTSAKKNHPQFLAGQASVFRSLDKDVLAMSFNVSNTTLDQLLAPQHESVILGCVSCADEELRIMEEERERAREEAREKEKEETERRKKERKKEEEEARKREEAAAKREEEERRKKQEEEEAEARRKEEEERRRREEEAAAREREREEEEAARKEEEERKRREEEERQREEEQEEETRRRQQEKEKEAARHREEERRRKEEQEEARQREQEQEETRRRQQEQEEEAAARQREEEEERQREQEEARQREQEQEEEQERQKRQEQEETRRREEQQEEEGGKSEGERAAEEERRREEEARREEEEGRGRGQGENQGWGKFLKKRLTV